MTAISPCFSVLMPTHDRADVLGFAIESVLAQTQPDFELLIVADGCTDETHDVVAGIDDPRIRFFDLPKAPFFGYANRNIALRQARGRFVAFAAHDDLLLPDHLARMEAVMERRGVDIAYSRPVWVSTDGVLVPFGVNLENTNEMSDFAVSNTIPASCVTTTLEALAHVGFYPEDIASAADWILWRRVIDRSASGIAHLRTPTSLHFSANWRRSRHAGVGEVSTLLALSEEAAWWPDILRPPLGEGPEQAALWRAMREGGDTWLRGVREAVDVVIDAVYWRAVREMVPRLKALEVDAAADPDEGLPCVVAGGTKLPGLVTAHEIAVVVPAGTTDLCLMSPCSRPEGDDVRTLGVIVTSLTIEARGVTRNIALDDPGLRAGFHGVERNDEGTWRWTDGAAELATSLWEGMEGVFLLRIGGLFDRHRDGSPHKS